jgi:6-phosphogluconolactonase (cycloisomerase 2 family)
MTRVTFVLSALLLVLAALPALPAQVDGEPPDRLFVVLAPADPPGPSYVRAFDVGEDGIPVAAGIYPTGGLGHRGYSNQGAAVTPNGGFLYVANNAGGSIAAFGVGPDGALDAVFGSPFEAGARPVFLAPHPAAPFLFATTRDAVRVFEIRHDGGLTDVQSVEEWFGRDLEVTPDGRFLYVTVMFGEAAGVRGFEIAADGRLAELPGSPTVYDSSRPSGIEISADGSRLYVLDLDAGIATFSIDDAGGLTQIGQRPIDGFATAMALTGDDRHLYVGEPYRPHVRGFSTGDDGVPVELEASPFPAEYTVAELIAPERLPRLYEVTQERSSILAMDIAADGTPAPIGPPVAVESPGGEIPNGAVYLAAGRLEIEIDIRPGSDRNRVNPRSNGKIPVAILGSDRFDAVDVERASVRFGPAEAIPAHPHPHDLEDVNGDGHPDAVFHFRTRDTGIAHGDETATLTGETIHGVRFTGTVTVLVK